MDSNFNNDALLNIICGDCTKVMPRLPDACVDFILTDFNTAEGRRFMDTTGAPRATLVLLDGQGQLVKVIYHPQTPATLKQELAAVAGK